MYKTPSLLNSRTRLRNIIHTIILLIKHTGADSVLRVLPSGSSLTLRRSPGDSGRIEPEAVGYIASRDGRGADGSKDLVGSGSIALSRASHEAGGALAVEVPVAEWITGSVGESLDGGARGHVGGVSDGELDGTRGVNVDLLATRDRDVL